LLPRFCQYGGCSRVCRRWLWRKIAHSAAVPVLAAAHFGDNVAKFANLMTQKKDTYMPCPYFQLFTFDLVLEA
jgi:hypothetical protein